MTSPLSKTGMAACLIILILCALTPLLQSDYLIDVVTEILIVALFALSLNIIIGYSGNVSFGHAAYFAIGGYVNAILLDDLWLATVALRRRGRPCSDADGSDCSLFLHTPNGHLLRHADLGVFDAGLGDRVQMALAHQRR